jgi:hypothetical protein
VPEGGDREEALRRAAPDVRAPATSGWVYRSPVREFPRLRGLAGELAGYD